MKSRDPYGYFSSVYTSEHIMDDLNPRWKPFSVLDADLCRGDYNAQLKLVVFDWDKVIMIHDRIMSELAESS